MSDVLGATEAARGGAEHVELAVAYDAILLASFGAMVLGCPVVTHNVRHFNLIEGLQVLDWHLER